MRKFKVTVHIFTKPAVLNPEEGPVLRELLGLGFKSFSKISMGKCFIIDLEAADEAEARKLVGDACHFQKFFFLVNPITELFEIVGVVEIK